MKKNKNIIILTGGTGGHIFPARCVAQELANNNFNVTICANKNYLKYSSYQDNFNYNIIAASAIKKNFISLLFGVFLIFFGIIKSFFLILFKRPAVIIAFGGYATFPGLISAVLLRRKIILHEQNAYLGKVNRIFAKFAKIIAISFKDTEAIKDEFRKKTQYIGNPIREEIIELSKNDYSYPNFEMKYKSKNNMGYDLILSSDFEEIEKIEREYFNILIIGGSGGAKIFSDILPKSFFNLRSELKRNIYITQQCRGDVLDKTFTQYKKFNLNIILKVFFDDIDQKIQDSHLVIARSGSSTIFELAAAKKPMILVPFANSADNHQQKNADRIVKNGGGIVINEKDFKISNLTDIIEKLIDNPTLLNRMSKDAFAVANINATSDFVKMIRDLT